MRWRLIACMVLPVLSLGIATAQVADILNQKVTLRLQNADFQAALQAVMHDSGAQVVFVRSDKPYDKVNVTLIDQPLESAVKFVCLAGGAEYRMEPGPVFVISHPGELPAEPKPAEPKPTQVTKADVVPAPMVETKIYMKHADAKEVLERLLCREPDLAFVQLARLQAAVRGGPRTIQAMPVLMYGGQPINNQPLGSSVTPDVSEPGYVPSGTNYSSGMETLLGAQVMGGGGGYGQPGGGGRFGGGGGGGFGQPGGFGGGGFNQPGLGGGGQPGRGGTGQGIGGTGLIPQNIKLLAHDPTDNSLVVQGQQEDIDKLRTLVKLFDIRPKQVQVKCEFITASTSKVESFGMDWMYQRVQVSAGNTPGSFAVSQDPIFINFAVGNLATRLRAHLVQGEGKIVNAPLVTTLNNQFAEVYQQLVIGIFLNQIVSTQNGNIVSPTLTQIPLNTGLIVQPRINADGTITLSVSPQVSDLGQIRKGPNGEEAPDQIYQGCTVSRIIKDGETMVLGGLTRKSETVSYSKFPVLGDLPILGQFFRSKSRNIDDSELLIFITPTVIPDEDTAEGALGP